jgi:hypothetical protein
MRRPGGRDGHLHITLPQVGLGQGSHGASGLVEDREADVGDAGEGVAGAFSVAAVGDLRDVPRPGVD